jgi:hypothetical protein
MKSNQNKKEIFNEDAEALLRAVLKLKNIDEKWKCATIIKKEFLLMTYEKLVKFFKEKLKRDFEQVAGSALDYATRYAPRLRQDLLRRWAHGVYQQRPCLLVMALDAGRETNTHRWHKPPLHHGTNYRCFIRGEHSTYQW